MRALPRVLLLAAVCASAPVAAASAPFAAWQVPPGYVEAAHDSAHERIYYFAPQGRAPDAANWTERVRVVGLQLAPGQNLPRWFDALRARAKMDCPGLMTRAGPSTPAGKVQDLFEMWHCPKSTLDGRGAVSLYKVIAVGSQVYALVAEGRYDAFAPGKTPVTRAQLARWTAFDNGFVLCEGYRKPSCMGDAESLASAPAAPMSLGETLAAARADMLGRELYRQDALAWQAAAALGAQRMKGIHGWVAIPDPRDAGGAVHFFRGDRDKPVLAWTVTLRPHAQPRINAGTPQQLTRALVTRFRARQTALAEQTRPCTQELNTAVLQDPSNGGWLVYTLAASRNPDEIWIGGSTRYTLAPDGITITSAHPSSRGCLMTHRKDATGRAIDDMVMTQSGQDMPDEMEVMRQLQTGLPMTIGTRTGVWRIRDGRLVKIDPRATRRMSPAS